MCIRDRPYTAYAKVTPDDVKALYAYFMHGVEPVKQANKDTDITWPLSMRWPLGVWRWMFAPDVVTAPVTAPASEADKVALLRGQYLVEGLGHCSTCHTQMCIRDSSCSSLLVLALIQRPRGPGTC